MEAISKIEGFSPAPRILGKAMALLRDPNSDINDISEIVSSDTALAAQMIRWANSAFYGTGSVSSLDQAVQKIGFRESIRLLNLSVARTMADVAIGVLHNVGNVLNSVNVSIDILTEKLRKSRVTGVVKLAKLFKEHTNDIGTYLTEDTHAFECASQHLDVFWKPHAIFLPADRKKPPLTVHF